MSVREADPTAPTRGSVVTGREVAIGKYTTVRRYLPDRSRRTIGAWCFVDRFGPEDLTVPGPDGRSGMWVPPHPHIGLQTVTWLYAGEVLHRDSVGTVQSVRPGQLNLMTSGHGIAHSEQSVPGAADQLHGLQLWIALPGADRDVGARFEHHGDLPTVTAGDGATVTVVVGELAGVVSPARVHTPLVGAAVDLPAAAVVELPVDPRHEHGVLVVSGEVVDGDVTLPDGVLHYRPPGVSALRLRAVAPSRVFLLGGEPYPDPLVMWWNFVGTDHDTVARARADWEAGRRFGRVDGFDGDPMPAPELPRVRLVARRADGTRAD